MTGDLLAPEHLQEVAGLSGEELAAGWPPGRAGGAVCTRSEAGASGVHPRAVLESLLAGAMSRGPVIVAFSGGRDSSALLALATVVGRREGLPLPIPLTMRFGDDPDADETTWQESVITHLRLEDWVRVDATSATDALGPYAEEVVRHVGHNVFPPAAAAAGVKARHARGASLVDGDPGDWVLGAHRMTYAHQVVRRHGRVGRSDWTVLAEALSPSPVRAARARRTLQPLPWLRPAVEARRRAAFAAEVRAEPLRWDVAVRGLPGWRHHAIGVPTVAAVVRAYGAQLLQPLGHPQFLDAYSSYGGWRGVPSRTAAMRLLVGDLLPYSVLSRRTKAHFNRAVFGQATRAFAREWDGTGVNDELVDAGRLRQEWLSERPDGRSLGLLQEAWLASNRLIGTEL
jgi:asparagine synthase (glutamine-hydrolysing)